MTLLRYRTTGSLTGTIPAEAVGLAQDYLTNDDMTQYLDDNRYPTLKDVIGHIRWHLNADGHTWYVEALAYRELTVVELEGLAQWVSGQNSDGLGEGFEQQDFCWVEEDEPDEDCSHCDGTGEYTAEDEDDELEAPTGSPCSECDGNGTIYGSEGGHMISFDWQTNECTFKRVEAQR